MQKTSVNKCLSASSEQFWTCLPYFEILREFMADRMGWTRKHRRTKQRHGHVLQDDWKNITDYMQRSHCGYGYIRQHRGRGRETAARQRLITDSMTVESCRINFSLDLNNDLLSDCIAQLTGVSMSTMGRLRAWGESAMKHARSRASSNWNKYSWVSRGQQHQKKK
jgi:hypothetical protein